MPLKIAFESSPEGKYLFREKHVRTIAQDVTVQSQIDLEAKAVSMRNRLNTVKVTKNTLFCMTLGQQESLFAWLDKFKSDELKKVTKEMTDISGIPIPGCIVEGKQAWGGGTFTLGFTYKGGTYWIVHLGKWDWSGRYPLTAGNTLSSSEKGAFTP